MNTGVKAVVCSNGHASTPNGRADDEGGGGSVSLPRVSYAAAARKAPSPQTNNSPPQFPQNTGLLVLFFLMKYIYHKFYYILIGPLFQ